MDYNAARADLDNMPFSVPLAKQHQLAMTTGHVIMRDPSGFDLSNRWPDQSNSRMSSSYTDQLMARSNPEIMPATNLPGTITHSIQECSHPRSEMAMGSDAAARGRGSSENSSTDLRSRMPHVIHLGISSDLLRVSAAGSKLALTSAGAGSPGMLSSASLRDELHKVRDLPPTFLPPPLALPSSEGLSVSPQAIKWQWCAARSHATPLSSLPVIAAFLSSTGEPPGKLRQRGWSDVG